MFEGARKLFPNDYERFKAEMIRKADEDDLPVMLSLGDIKDFSLRDFQDAFREFNLETGLELFGRFSLDDITGKLSLILQVDKPDPAVCKPAILQ